MTRSPACCGPRWRPSPTTWSGWPPATRAADRETWLRVRRRRGHRDDWATRCRSPAPPSTRPRRRDRAAAPPRDRPARRRARARPARPARAARLDLAAQRSDRGPGPGRRRGRRRARRRRGRAATCATGCPRTPRRAMAVPFAPRRRPVARRDRARPGCPRSTRCSTVLAGADEAVRRTLARGRRRACAPTPPSGRPPCTRRPGRCRSPSGSGWRATPSSPAVIAFGRAGFSARDAAYGVWNALVRRPPGRAPSATCCPAADADVLLRPWRAVYDLTGSSEARPCSPLRSAVRRGRWRSSPADFGGLEGEDTT